MMIGGDSLVASLCCGYAWPCRDGVLMPFMMGFYAYSYWIYVIIIKASGWYNSISGSIAIIIVLFGLP